MSDTVTIELIRATAAVVPSLIAGVAAILSWKAAVAAKSTAVKVDGLLEDRVQAATDLGHAEGKAVGVDEERNRT